MEEPKLFQILERELWLVTAHNGSRGGGLIATWVSQASIDPQTPTVAIAIAVNHFTRELIDESQSFGLHLLRQDQLDLVWNFALGSGRDKDKLAGLSWNPGLHGAPLLSDCLGSLDCRVYDRYDGGDRIYYWADVLAQKVRLTLLPSSPILTDCKLIAQATDEQKKLLRAGMLADIEIQRPLLAAHRAALR